MANLFRTVQRLLFYRDGRSIERFGAHHEMGISALSTAARVALRRHRVLPAKQVACQQHPSGKASVTVITQAEKYTHWPI
jgi:hypothetical protein